MDPHLTRLVPSACALLLVFAAGCREEGSSAPASSALEPFDRAALAEPATWAGGLSCGGCHPDQSADWAGSHHDLAMDEATPDTVLGDFDDASFTLFGVTTRFHRGPDDSFRVTTEGPDGTLEDYEVSHVFGVDPLQQYLVPFPDGRYQMLTIAWDARPAEAGGQRWYSLYPDERIEPGDPLHWTARDQNWNYMCADCHSTRLERNYDLATKRYDTTWSEIDVSCEACHGPASRHLLWAGAAADGIELDDVEYRGFDVRLGDADGGVWLIDPETGNATRNPPRTSRAQIETCAPCHARRIIVDADYVHGRPLLDTHRPRLLEDRDLYEVDGQIHGEVYVYGSFAQSKMYMQGVACSDCHDPHTLRPRAAGNGVCATCHLPARYDTPEHHFHPLDGPGAACVDCHMPERTYMGVDPRRDHSLRVPRPDLSVTLGTPNACNSCHADQSPGWAAEAVAEWYGPDRRQEPHYGEVFWQARIGAPGALEALIALAGDTEQPPIVRATALHELGGLQGPLAQTAITEAAADPDPLVRAAAARAMGFTDRETRVRVAGPLARDPVRDVRIAAAHALAPVRPEQLDAGQQHAFRRALNEAVEAELAAAERPESHMNLGNLYMSVGRFDEAEQAYRTALELDPRFVAALINLADLYRAQRRDSEGELFLRRALEEEPDNAPALHALGLLLVRDKRYDDAMPSLARASRLAPDNPRFGYVYAVALSSVGRRAEALAELDQVHQRHPGDRQTLEALVAFSRDEGDRDLALLYVRKLVALAPDNAMYRQLLKDLEPG